MTGNAGQFPFLMTGRFNQAVVLAPRDPDHPVRPIVILDKRWVLLQGLLEPGLVQLGGPDERSSLIEVLSRTILEPVLVPFIAAHNPFDAVALPADLGGGFGRGAAGVDHGGIRLLAVMAEITMERRLVGLDMVFRRAMAGLASDA